MEYSTDNHILCIIEVAAKLFDKGYNVYLEYKIQKYPNTPNLRNMCYKADIYAVKDQQEIIIEVGSLSQHSKLKELKRLKPNAQIIHILQWGKSNSTRLKKGQ